MILFAGDSFSAWDDNESWTYQFANTLGLGFRNCSIEGSSIWTAFSQIDIERYKIMNNYYEYLVITCTNYRRIPFCQDAHMSYFVGKIEKEPFDTEEKKYNMAHVNYYDRFYSEKMHKFLYESILNYVITTFRNHTKIILLPVMDDSLISVKTANNIFPDSFMFLNFPLFNISSKNKDAKNHFSKDMNINFGKLLAEHVKKTDSGQLNVTIKEIKEAIN
jgi:hypothetical protein